MYQHTMQLLAAAVLLHLQSGTFGARCRNVCLHARRPRDWYLG